MTGSLGAARIHVKVIVKGVCSQVRPAGIVCPPGGEAIGAIEAFKALRTHMVTFISMLTVGAIFGFMLEQQVGAPLVRWSRVKRMRMRILRRKGESPWVALLQDDD